MVDNGIKVCKKCGEPIPIDVYVIDLDDLTSFIQDIKMNDKRPRDGDYDAHVQKVLTEVQDRIAELKSEGKSE